MANSDHYTDPTGHHINIVPMQDALGPNCQECGRTVFPRAKAAGGVAEPWQHAMDCSSYLPHPDSIAGRPGYNA